MAPLSYYWFISFIYLVIEKNVRIPCTPYDFLGFFRMFSFHNTFIGAKKRYVYMVQSGIMNYTG